MKRNILIGVAWPYVNGELHIGHLAGYLMPADIEARYQRLIGNNVLMVSGSDCFGTPTTVEADKRKITPTEVANEYHNDDVVLFRDILHLSYDLHTLTNHENHIKITQEFFLKFLEAGLLFKDKNDQYYSPTLNKFLPDRYVVGECPHCGYKDCRSDQCDNCGKLLVQGELKNAKSNLSGEPVELKQSEHYFINWPKLSGFLEKYVEVNSSSWKEWVRAECKGWLKEGLQPRAITRDLDWGVPIPTERIPEDMQLAGAEHKRIYVWFDAVIGYFSASLLWAKEKATPSEGGTDAWKKFWYDDEAAKNNQQIKQYYFMGKDNLVFHTLFWPAQVNTYDKQLHLPDVNSINMFLNYDGKQFSKSRGWTIKIKDMVEKFGNDAVRFYLTLIMPETRDASFNWDDFKEKNNGILVANLGNFINRVLSLGKDFDFSNASNTLSSNVTDEINTEISKAFVAANIQLENCEFRNYLETLLQLSSFGNSLIDREKVWELKKGDPQKFAEVITKLMKVVVALDLLIKPLLFEASDKLNGFLGNCVPELWSENVLLEINNAVSNVRIQRDFKPLFTKFEGEIKF